LQGFNIASRDIYPVLVSQQVFEQDFERKGKFVDLVLKSIQPKNFEFAIPNPKRVPGIE
jgi:hypothetical protein